MLACPDGAQGKDWVLEIDFGPFNSVRKYTNILAKGNGSGRCTCIFMNLQKGSRRLWATSILTVSPSSVYRDTTNSIFFCLVLESLRLRYAKQAWLVWSASTSWLNLWVGIVRVLRVTVQRYLKASRQ